MPESCRPSTNLRTRRRRARDYLPDFSSVAGTNPDSQYLGGQGSFDRRAQYNRPLCDRPWTRGIRDRADLQSRARLVLPNDRRRTLPKYRSPSWRVKYLCVLHLLPLWADAVLAPDPQNPDQAHVQL